VTQNVAQINLLTGQIAQLNGQVAQLTGAGKDGGAIEDQRDQLVQQLSTLTGISVMQTSEGETITTGSGTPLVMADRSYSLQTTTGTTACSMCSTQTESTSPRQFREANWEARSKFGIR